jgi:actin-related protein
MSRGAVSSWDEIEPMMQHCFEQIGVADELDDTSIIITAPPYQTRACTERLAQTCIEAFNMTRIAIVPSGHCALYASGRTTGLVLDSGEGTTSITPVCDSFPILHQVQRLDWGGSDVTEHLRRLLYERALNFTSTADILTVREMKEQHAYVAASYAEERVKDPAQFNVPFGLPDGQTVELGSERFRCAEILFQPSIVQQEFPSISTLVTRAITGCAIDMRRALSSNIILSGGNTMLPGFSQRLQEDVLAAFPGLFGSVKVLDTPNRTTSVWTGASVMGSLEGFDTRWVTREVYDEYGPGIVHDYRRPPDDDEDE